MDNSGLWTYEIKMRIGWDRGTPNQAEVGFVVAAPSDFLAIEAARQFVKEGGHGQFVLKHDEDDRPLPEEGWKYPAHSELTALTRKYPLSAVVWPAADKELMI